MSYSVCQIEGISFDSSASATCSMIKVLNMFHLCQVQSAGMLPSLVNLMHFCREIVFSFCQKMFRVTRIGGPDCFFVTQSSLSKEKKNIHGLLSETLSPCFGQTRKRELQGVLPFMHPNYIVLMRQSY